MKLIAFTAKRPVLCVRSFLHALLSKACCKGGTECAEFVRLMYIINLVQSSGRRSRLAAVEACGNRFENLPHDELKKKL